MKQELKNVQTGFRKARGTGDQIANIHWIIEKTRDFQKNICFIWLRCSLWLCGSQQTGKFLEIGIPDHLTCLPWNLCAGQEATVRTGQGKTGSKETIWTHSKLGKEYIQATYCHLAYLTYMQSTSCEMLGWMKLASRLLREISMMSDIQLTPP